MYFFQMSIFFGESLWNCKRVHVGKRRAREMASIFLLAVLQCEVLRGDREVLGPGQSRHTQRGGDLESLFVIF